MQKGSCKVQRQPAPPERPVPGRAAGKATGKAAGKAAGMAAAMGHGAGVLIHDGRGRILLGLRKDGWTSFSGGAEDNETPEQTALRECAEETLYTLEPPVTAETLKVDPGGPLITKTPSGREFHLFLVRIDYDPTLGAKFGKARASVEFATRRECLEMSKIQWFGTAELTGLKLRLPLSQNLAEILRRLEE